MNDADSQTRSHLGSELWHPGAFAGLTEACTTAVTRLQEVLGIDPWNRYEEIDVAERAIVRLRDGLIDQLRQEADPAVWLQATSGAPGNVRSVLDQVNVALSLVTGVEYPGAGIQEASLQQAHDVLKDLLALEKEGLEASSEGNGGTIA